MSLLCKIGIHKWGRVSPAVYLDERHEHIADPVTPATRVCQRCDLEQYQDVHCLGLNPPDYARTWRKLA